MPLPLQIAYETLVALLEASLKRGPDEEGRGALARAVRFLPLTCSEAGNLARANPRAPLLLALCDYLYGSGERARYCDGLPDCVSPADGPQTPPPNNPSHPLELDDVFDLRNQWASDNALHPDHVATCSDLPAGLPDGVLVLVGRVRMVHAEMRTHPLYDRFFTTCQRKGCARPALIAPPKPRMPAPKARDSHDYWQLCATGSATVNARRQPRNMSFCCEGCFRVVDREFRSEVDALADVESAEFLPRSSRRDGAAPGAVTIGPCSAGKLYEAALLRNALLNRRIRKGLATAPATRHYPLTKADAEVMQQQAIDAVNVDLGVLFAAAVVANNAPRWRPASLPCATDWRKRINAYRNAVAKVRGIYKQYADSNSVCKGNARWLRKVRKASEGLFV
jgi:hypothetical protein